MLTREELARIIYNDSNQTFGEALGTADAVLALMQPDDAMVKDLTQALEGMLMEWDKLTRYGSPMARAANERVTFARACLTAAMNREQGQHSKDEA